MFVFNFVLFCSTLKIVPYFADMLKVLLYITVYKMIHPKKTDYECTCIVTQPNQ